VYSSHFAPVYTVPSSINPVKCTFILVASLNVPMLFDAVDFTLLRRVVNYIVSLSDSDGVEHDCLVSKCITQSSNYQSLIVIIQVQILEVAALLTTQDNAHRAHLQLTTR